MGASNTIIQFAAAFGIVFLCILNGIVLVLGIATIVIGTELRKEVDKRDDIMNLLDEVDLGDVTLADIVDILIKVVISIGAFAVVTTLIGGIGAICRLRPLLIVYIVIVIFCIIVEIVALSYWIKLINGVDTWLRGQFNDLLMKYKGISEKDVYSIGWNLIFIFFTCCGVEPITVTNNDFRDLPAEWWPSRGSDVIPSSCCEGAEEESYTNYTNTVCTENLIDYHKAGCYDVFDELFTRLTAAAISITVFIILVEFSEYLRDLKKKGGNRMISTRKLNLRGQEKQSTGRQRIKTKTKHL